MHNGNFTRQTNCLNCRINRLLTGKLEYQIETHLACHRAQTTLLIHWKTVQLSCSACWMLVVQWHDTPQY